MVLVIYGTLAKNRWGINLEPSFCPSCTAPAPRVRTPTSLQQILWGGWTCSACGAESDKVGTPNKPTQPTAKSLTHQTSSQPRFPDLFLPIFFRGRPPRCKARRDWLRSYRLFV